MRKRDNYQTEAENLWQLRVSDPGVEKIALELPKYLRAAYVLEQIALAAVTMDPGHELHHQAATWLSDKPTFWQRLAAANGISRTVRYDRITRKEG